MSLSKSLVGLALSSAMTLPAAAQDSGPIEAAPPSIAISYATQAAAHFVDLAPGGTVAVEEYQAYAALYRFDRQSSHVDLSIDYQYTHYDYEGINSRDRDLHRFQFPIRFNAKYDNWRFDGYVAANISTSSNIFKDCLNRCSSEDMWTSGRFEAGHKVASRTWIIGLAHDRTFGKPSGYPILGVEFEPSDALKIRIAYPHSAFHFVYSDRNSFSGRIFSAGHQWRVVSDDFQSDFDYRVEGLRSQLSWSHRIWRKISIDVSATYEFERRHRLENDQGFPLDADIGSQWGLAIGVRVGASNLPLTHGSHL